MSSLPRLPELAREVAEITNGVIAASRAAGRDDLAALLVQAASRWSAPGTTVAVVGEGGVGKTALVNALVGAEVLPTRDLVGRSVLAAVRPGEHPAVTAQGRTSPLPLELDPGAIAAWLEAQGPLSGGLTALDVVVADPATGPTTTLVDTPGVSPAGAGRGRAVVTAQQCDVLVFVTDADSPLTRPELDLLRAARGTAGAVLVVLSRVDRFRGWATVQRADVALLAAELPGAVPSVLPVSSSLAAAAAALRDRDADGADALEDESGVRAVRRELTALSSRTREVRLLGLLRLALEVGVELQADRARAEEVAALDRVAADEQATEAQAALDRLREHGRQTLLALADETQRLREMVLLEVKRAGTAALAAADAAPRRKDDPEDVGPLLDELDASRVTLEASVAERVEQLSAWLLERLQDQASDASPLTAPVPRPGPSVFAAKDRSMRLRVVAALVSTGSGAVLLGTMFLPELGAARPALLSAGMLGGGVSAVAALRQTATLRTSTARRTALRALVDEWQAVTASELRGLVVSGQRRAEGALRRAVDEAVEERGREVAALRARAAGAAVEGGPRDARALAAHLARAAELAALLEAAP